MLDTSLPEIAICCAIVEGTAEECAKCIVAFARPREPELELELLGS